MKRHSFAEQNGQAKCKGLFWPIGFSLNQGRAGRKGRAQSSIEFLLIIAFMTLAFVSFFALANSRLAESTEQKTFQTAADIAAIVTSQVDVATGVNGGFSTRFLVPQTVDGSTYNITIVDKRELIVLYKGYEHLEFLPVNVSGRVVFGENLLSKSISGKLSLNE